MKMNRSILLLLAALLAFPLAGCDSEPPLEDAGPGDASPPPDDATPPPDDATPPPGDSGPADSGPADSGPADASPPSPTAIVTTLAADTRFSTLVAAVSGAAAGGGAAGDLVDGLSTDTAGPYTVFAPTNDAFVASGVDPSAATTPELMAGLLQTLVYHVVAGQLDAGSLPPHTPTVSTQTWLDDGGTPSDTSDDDMAVVALSMLLSGTNVNGGNTSPGGAGITESIPCTNGVIHVIDRVLAPQTVAQLAPSFSGALWAAGIVDPSGTDVASPLPDALCDSTADPTAATPVATALGRTCGGRPYTLFLPDDLAFATFAGSLPTGTTSSPGFPDLVRQLIGLHLATETVPVTSANLATRPALPAGVNSLSGQMAFLQCMGVCIGGGGDAAMCAPSCTARPTSNIPLSFTVGDSTMTPPVAPGVSIAGGVAARMGGNGANITTADLGAINGVIHVIDTVLSVFQPTTLAPSGAIETFTVPAGATGLRIAATGATGGDATNSDGSLTLGGNGAVVRTFVTAAAGDVLSVLAGGQPAVAVHGSDGCGGGGGGGSFVVRGADHTMAMLTDALAVAGGGGGATGFRSSPRSGSDATTPEGDGSGGTIESTLRRSGGGGGFLGDGASPTTTAYGSGGAAFTNGGAGGRGATNEGCSGGAGGFGGGGGGSYDFGGGGGGYTGGNANPTVDLSAEGGTSFAAGSGATITVRTDRGPGSVVIQPVY